MTARELLELAAKAAGYHVAWNDNWKCFQHINPAPDSFGSFRHPWTPDTDDGDALRLAVKLELVISHWPNNEPPSVMAGFLLGNIGDNLAEPYGDDPVAATRRAIVRAAAEIAKDAL